MNHHYVLLLWPLLNHKMINDQRAVMTKQHAVQSPTLSHFCFQLQESKGDFISIQFYGAFRTAKSSHGVSRVGVTNSWDDCPYTLSNANTYVRARAYGI